MSASERLLRRPTVLAVDDQPANLVALDAVLGADYEVVRATSGPAALAILERRADIDVILMDIQMPGMDGFEAAARIKQIPACRDIPVILITAVYREDPFVKQGYSIGAVDYFSKPFDPEILRVKVGIYAAFRRRAAILEERERQIRESEKLLEAQRRMSAILDNPAIGVIVTDAAGEIRAISEQVPKILGCASPWEDGSPCIALARELCEAATSRAGGELRAQPSGSTLVATASRLQHPDGTLAGAVVVIEDLAERRELETDIEQRIGRLMTGDARSAPR